MPRGAPSHRFQPAKRLKEAVMAPIVSSTEVARQGQETFADLTDARTMPEWQQGCVRGRLDGAPTRVGSKRTTVRRMGGREPTVSS
jgi:hypothetical protein